MDKIIGFISKIDVIKLGIAFTVMICLNWIVYALVTHEIPEGNKEVLIHSLGLIEGVVVTIAAYYWGSSSGSKDKTDALTKITEKKNPV